MESKKTKKSKLKKNGKRKAGRVSKVDEFGEEYGGSITALRINSNQDFSIRPRGPLPQANYSTCQMVNDVTISTGLTTGGATTIPFVQASNAAITGVSMAFSLQDVAQVTSFTGLFDQYRFDKVELKFVPQSTSINLSQTASPNNSNPTIMAVLDFDDATAPTTISQIQQYDNVQAAIYGEGLHLQVRPSITPAVYASGAFSGYQVRRATWIDCANTAVAHYGVKAIITELSALSTQTVVWDVYVKYYLSFRNTR